MMIVARILSVINQFKALRLNVGTTGVYRQEYSIALLLFGLGQLARLTAHLDEFKLYD